MIRKSEAPTRLVLLGHPVSHSLSPIFQNAALKSAGLSASYDALDVVPHDLLRVLRDLARAAVAGNVTIPHKEAVALACSKLTDLAQRVGAVNTFWHEKGKLVGDNTDVAGARVAIATLLDAPSLHQVRRDTKSPLHVTILGAGGAAAALLVALEAFIPVTITIWSRTSDRARALAARVNVAVTIANDAKSAVAEADLVINCTPIGLSGTDVPVDVAALKPTARILDLIPRAGETEWLRACRAQGHVCDDGVRMLIEQGAASFERWFDIVPDRASMWRSLR
ncbi:MAG: shikimate dehydrogenase [Gemmatimonadaceae bacterium]